MIRTLGLVLATGAFGVLAACDGEPEAVAPERIRSIKPYYVSEPAGGEIRRLSGKITAANTSALSFAVSGKVATVLVKQGARVKIAAFFGVGEPCRQKGRTRPPAPAVQEGMGREGGDRPGGGGVRCGGRRS
jgi:hypothetical protein